VYSFNRLRSDPALELSIYALDIADVGELDPSTVRLRTREPVILLLSKLQYLYVIPEGSSPESLREREDGTGPYRLERWVKGATIRMSAVEDFWGGKPPLDRVSFRLARTVNDSIADLASGTSQLVQCSSRKIEKALPADGSISLKRRSSLFVKYLGFDVGREVTPYCPVRPNPFRQERVREAIDLAIDRDGLTAGLSTDTHPASQLVPPFIFGFDPSLAPPPHRPEEARRLLAEAGLPGGFRVTLHCRDIMAETAGIVSRMLAEVGIEVTVRVLPDAEFRKLLTNHGVSLFLDRYGCETGDASEVFDDIIHSPDARGHYGQGNSGNFTNRELDEAIESCAVELAVARRSEMLKRIMATIHEERPVIPLDIEEDAYAIRKDYRWEPRDDSDIRAAEIAPAIARPESGKQ
jgi:peptide/nickel transport system substrate-binding protein